MFKGIFFFYFFFFFSSGGHFVQPSSTFLAILVKGTLLWNYFEIRTLAAEEMSFKGFSIFSSGRHFVQPIKAILVILVEGHWWNTSMQIFWNQAIGQGRDVVWRFSIFQLWLPSFSMEQNHCGHLGFSIGTILACFDPEVILLLQSKFRLKAI